ncbi:MAG: 4-hydroxythreonine-4-phosphate dehydrogenase PdxA, partial [Flavobacteriales bacterium]|nr:4-hydroxythreonine-4-phosphate dehydrogenase PdxA [Flavobacteriales bacterium]
MSQGKAALRVGITCGDLNGIGLEVVLRTFEDARMLQDITPVLYASVRTLGHHRKAVGADEVPVHGIADASEAAPRKLNVVNIWEEDVPVEFGKPSGESAKYAIKSLEAATQDIAAGKVDVLVTAPIDKHAMQAAGFEHTGHTEYLKHVANVEEVLMVLMDLDGHLRVGTVTGHIPLGSVPMEVTQER